MKTKFEYVSTQPKRVVVVHGVLAEKALSDGSDDKHLPNLLRV
jgi:hypothetical protein